MSIPGLLHPSYVLTKNIYISKIFNKFVVNYANRKIIKIHKTNKSKPLL